MSVPVHAVMTGIGAWRLGIELFTREYDPQEVDVVADLFGESEEARLARAAFLARVGEGSTATLPSRPKRRQRTWPQRASGVHRETGYTWLSRITARFRRQREQRRRDPDNQLRVLPQELPNAQLLLFPDSNHGSQFPFPEVFVREVNDFLND